MELLTTLLKQLGHSDDLTKLLKEKMTKEETDDFLTKQGEEHTSNFMTLEQAKAHPDVRSHIAGGVTASVSKGLQKQFGLTDDEIKDKKIEEIQKLAFDKSDAQQKELKERINKEAPEQIIKLTSDLDKSGLEVTRLGDLYQIETDLNKDLSTQLENKDTEYKIDTYKINSINSVSIDPNADEVKKLGWDTLLTNNLQWKLDGEKVIVTDKEGKQIVDPANQRNFLEGPGAVKQLANDNGLLVKNESKPTYKPPEGTPKMSTKDADLLQETIKTYS